MSSNPFAFLAPGPILVSGAGPTGLIFSLWLHCFRIPHRLIDLAPRPDPHSRALVIHARTLEFYDQLGIVDRIVEAGTKVDGMVIYRSGIEQCKIRWYALTGNEDLSRYPYALSLQQDQHEAILNEVIAERGLKIERGVELVDARELEDSVRCTLKHVETGEIETFNASYVVGADGAHSRVRRAAGISMEGGTSPGRFYVADVKVSSHLPSPSSINMNLSSGRDFCMVMPLDNDKGHTRIGGFVPPAKQDEKGNLTEETTFADVEKRVAVTVPSLKITDVQWFSTWRVNHRVASAFRSTFHPDTKSGELPRPGRLFVAGDAAHLHSPVGGQGMNTGIGDATNLAWKLAAVHSGTGPASLLETYEPERQPFAKLLVNTTDQVFNLITNPGLLGLLIRTLLIPYILPFLLRIVPSINRRMLVTAGQLKISYPQSNISEHEDVVGGNAKAGDRLPFLQVDRNGGGVEDNHSVLQGKNWQAHIYGTPEKATSQLLEDRGVPLWSFPWSTGGGLAKDMTNKGFRRNAVYIIRPDGYIGLVCRQGDGMTLARYLDKWDIGTRN